MCLIFYLFIISSPLTRIIQPHKIVVFVYTDTFWPIHFQPIQYSAQTQLVVCVVIVFSLLLGSVKFSQTEISVNLHIWTIVHCLLSLCICVKIRTKVPIKMISKVLELWDYLKKSDFGWIHFYAAK